MIHYLNIGKRLNTTRVQQHKKAFKGITQQIAADEVCELAKSKIGLGNQSAVHKILKWYELPAKEMLLNLGLREIKF